MTEQQPQHDLLSEIAADRTSHKQKNNEYYKDCEEAQDIESFIQTPIHLHQSDPTSTKYQRVEYTTSQPYIVINNSETKLVSMLGEIEGNYFKFYCDNQIKVNASNYRHEHDEIANFVRLLAKYLQLFNLLGSNINLTNLNDEGEIKINSQIQFVGNKPLRKYDFFSINRNFLKKTVRKNQSGGSINSWYLITDKVIKYTLTTVEEENVERVDQLIELKQNSPFLLLKKENDKFVNRTIMDAAGLETLCKYQDEIPTAFAIF